MLRFKGNILVPSGPNPAIYGNALPGTQRDHLSTKGQLDDVNEDLQSQIDDIQSGLPLLATQSTTNGNATTIATVAIPASTTVLIEARVVARRTGGSAGSAEDGAAYFISACYKNVAGTATEIGEASIFTSEDQAGWNATFIASGANALIQVTGATNNNVNWKCFYTTYSIS